MVAPEPPLATNVNDWEADPPPAAMMPYEALVVTGLMPEFVSSVATRVFVVAAVPMFTRVKATVLV